MVDRPRTLLALTPLLLAASLLAEPFDSRLFRMEGGGGAAVTCNGVDLFRLSSGGGGYTAVQRAAIIARRLNEIMGEQDITPTAFKTGTSKGEVVLQYQSSSGQAPEVLLTVDHQTARTAIGAHGSRERLAAWWLALLRDHICLILGKEPVFTAAVPVGAVFGKAHGELDTMGGRPTTEAITEALRSLTPQEIGELSGAAGSVPSDFDADRVEIILTGGGKPAPEPRRREAVLPTDKGGSAAAGSSASPRSEAPTEASAAEKPVGPSSPEALSTRPLLGLDLETMPEKVEVGTEVKLLVRLFWATVTAEAKLETQPVLDAAMAARFEIDEKAIASPVWFRPGLAKGSYEAKAIFDKAGHAIVKIGILTPDAETRAITRTLQVAPASKPGAKVVEVKETPTGGGTAKVVTPGRKSPRDYVDLSVKADSVEAKWTLTDPAPLTVTFTLEDGAGTPLQRKVRQTAPFEAKFRRQPNATTLTVTCDYESGVRSQVSFPLEGK